MGKSNVGPCSFVEHGGYFEAIGDEVGAIVKVDEAMADMKHVLHKNQTRKERQGKYYVD